MVKAQFQSVRIFVSSLVIAVSAVDLSGCGSATSGKDGAEGNTTDSMEAVVDTRPIEVRLAEIEEAGLSRAPENVAIVATAIVDPSPEIRKAANMAAERIKGYGVPVNPYWAKPRLRQAQADFKRMCKLTEELGVDHFVDTVPTLIDRLEDPSLDVRRQAFEDVRRTTGVDFGFRPNGTPEQREHIVSAYRRLWQHWNRGDANALELMRDPDLRAEHKRQRIAEMTRAE